MNNYYQMKEIDRAKNLFINRIKEIMQEYSISPNSTAMEFHVKIVTMLIQCEFFTIRVSLDNENYLKHDTFLIEYEVRNEELSGCVEQILLEWIRYLKGPNMRFEKGLLLVTDIVEEALYESLLQEARKDINEEQNVILSTYFNLCKKTYLGGVILPGALKRFQPLRAMIRTVLDNNPLCVLDGNPIERLLLEQFAYFRYYGTGFRIITLNDFTSLRIKVRGISDVFTIPPTCKDFEAVLLAVRDFRKFPNLIKQPYYLLHLLLAKMGYEIGKYDLIEILSREISNVLGSWEEAELLCKKLGELYDSQQCRGIINHNDREKEFHYRINRFELDNHYHFFIEKSDVAKLATIDSTHELRYVQSNEKYPEEIEEILSTMPIGILPFRI